MKVALCPSCHTSVRCSVSWGSLALKKSVCSRKGRWALPQNEAVVRLLLALATQWRFAEGVPIGLDYVACQATAAALKVEWVGVLGGLRVMEAEMLKVQRERWAT